MGKLTCKLAIMSLGWLTLAGLASPTFGQAVENAIKFDVSPPLASIRLPARPRGAFLREHIVKKIPLPPVKLAALADTVLQSKATAKLPIGAIKPIDGIGRGIYSIMSDPPDTNGSVGKILITCNG